MPEDETDSTPSPESDTDEDAAETFANEWASYKQQQEDDHSLLTSMADALESFFGKTEMNEQQPPTPDPAQPRAKKGSPAAKNSPRISPQGSSAGQEAPQVPTRVPDSKPEESHWYWRPRFKRGG